MARDGHTLEPVQPRRSLAVRHACGHEHVHAVPRAFVDGAPSALLLADALASNECPACAAGLPKWIADPSGASQSATSAPAC